MLSVADPNAPIAERIATGTFGLAVDFFGLERAPDASFRVAFLDVVPVNVAETLAGGGQCVVSGTSFVDGTGTPRHVSDVTTLVAGQFETLPFAMELPSIGPGFGRLRVGEARLTGVVTVDNVGATLGTGELSGVVQLADWLGAQNEGFEAECGCVAPPGPLFAETASDFECVAGTRDVSGCTDPSCEQRLEFCAISLAFAKSARDIDLDGVTSTFEALSLGARVVGVPVDIAAP